MCTSSIWRECCREDENAFVNKLKSVIKKKQGLSPYFGVLCSSREPLIQQEKGGGYIAIRRKVDNQVDSTPPIDLKNDTPIFYTKQF